MTETIGPADTTPGKRPRLAFVCLGLAGLLALILIAINAFGEDVEVRIDQATAQAAIDAGLNDEPINRLGVTIIPEQLDIEFTPSNRVGLDADIGLEGYQRTGRVSGTFQSGIRYDGGRFYLNDILPVDVELDLDPDTQSEVSDLAQVLRDKLKRERAAIEDGVTTDAFDRLVTRNEERLKTTAVTSAQAVFGSIPIYDLRDAGVGGAVARLALDDVRFEAGEAILTLSPQRAVANIVTGIGIALMMLAYVFLQSPGLLIRALETKPESETPTDPK